jgi:thiol-disulfide isomerase/thioredoxin
VVQRFDGQARFVVENYGDSALAKRFGVTRYPAIFVDDVLVAKPKDFGFYGKGEGSGDGRYTPWKTAASYERFQGDLSRMITLLLAGKKDEARAAATPADRELRQLPAFSLTDLDGRTLTAPELAGRVVVVEFWATWCPPCQGTLAWLGDLKKRLGDRIAVLAIAIESEDADVRKRAAELGLPFSWVIGTPEVARSFGDVSAVPTLFVFGPDGQTAASYFGAPPTLHADAEARIDALLVTR